MSQKVLDYCSPESAPEQAGNRTVLSAVRIVIFTAIAVNAVLLSWAALLPGWVCLFILIAAVPINILLILLSVVFIPSVRNAAGGASVKAYVLIGVLAPVAGFLVDCGCVFAIHRYEVP